MDAGAWASWAAVVVAVIVAIRAYVSERRSKKSAAEAEELRRQTADAAVRSVGAIEQVAEALREANRQAGDPEGVALYRGPTWSLDHVSGSKFALVNNTPYAQNDVTISGDAVLRGPVKELEVPAFQEVQFMGLDAWGVNNKITVTWTDNLNDKQEWSKALPPKR